MCSLEAETKAVERLQRICSELSELQRELNESSIETSRIGLVRQTLQQMLMTAMTLQQGFEWVRLAQDRHGLWALLNDERLRRASELNTDIVEALEAGQIRTDQEGLSAYLSILNRVMEKIDLIFNSRKT
jgi:hypothetical protein